MSATLTESDIKEINLSIDFGQRLMKYYKHYIDVLLSKMPEDNSNYKSFYESDKKYINDIIEGLERGEEIQFLYPIKKRLTVVGQEFFKKEFKKLREIS